MHVTTTAPVRNTALAFISDACKLAQDDALWSLFCDRMHSYGLDRLLYGFTALPEPGPNAPSNWILRSSHGETYTRRFVAEDLYLDTRYAIWARDHTGTLLWSRHHMLAPGDPVSETRLRELNRMHQLRAGAMVSFPVLPNHTHATLVLAARPDLPQSRLDRLWLRQRDEIEAQIHVFHQRFQLIYTDGFRLTARQKEVLRRVAAGFTVQQIAQELDLSPATIDKHLRLAREALDATTTAQAIARALRFSQLYT
ncbi:helix-turn-helix transcriptional regulator [Limimaricola cinnabarinus]|jgi:LuxR family transcriptional regulator|uniref:HTH luxR-type domain-containing protein n=1 Tax=Limimaricola cinnabarinus TaxID=1125964 RepID=A0A2G1MK56_9RHOB|nr:LuxR family transcriptional regulator [Limimaricola cinnabarinus]PHP29042.1 hypothetical protein CJ301_00705 [Limimaricola cinnabarinus]